MAITSEFRIFMSHKPVTSSSSPSLDSCNFDLSWTTFKLPNNRTQTGERDQTTRFLVSSLQYLTVPMTFCLLGTRVQDFKSQVGSIAFTDDITSRYFLYYAGRFLESVALNLHHSITLFSRMKYLHSSAINTEEICSSCAYITPKSD